MSPTQKVLDGVVGHVERVPATHPTRSKRESDVTHGADLPVMTSQTLI